jgi:hypothetical protein
MRGFRTWRNRFNLGLLLTAVLAMAGCGGSGGDLGTTGTIGGGSGGGGTTPTITMSLQLVSAIDGQPTQTITSAAPGRIIATVNGITSPVVVTFSADVGEIPVPTAITDSSNQATVDILAGSSLGAGTITATLATGESASMVFAVGATNLLMGSGSPFQEGVASVSQSPISAGGTTTVTVQIVDENGNPFTQPVDVNFSSACSSAATPTAVLSSPVTTVNGVASSTYLAQGCVGDDPINVTANAGGVSLSANATVNVLPANVGSIEFVSATPTNIGIQGAGAGSESSTVVFRVRDTNGNPVNGTVVDFSLNTQVGGINLNPIQATSNSQGLVQTVVNSGTVATTVRVTATINGSSPVISTQSSQLVVSTGIPDQNSMSLSADVVNPEGWGIDGIEVNVTARLADHFGNPVPDGTAVNFVAEGGSIEPFCVTVNGACSVKWVSQNPRPAGQVLNPPVTLPEEVNTLGQPYGGRVTILATAIGEESFPDQNGNNRFDSAEMPLFGGLDVSGNPFDLKEAFVDYNEDGLFNPAEGYAGTPDGSGDLEEFVDFNGDASFTLNDGAYNGVLCSIPAHAGCSSQTSTNVRASLVIVMSGSNPFMVVTSTNDTGSVNDPGDGSIYLAADSVGSASIILADLHNQPMPAGTQVKFTATVGSVVGPSTFTWPNDNHNGGRSFAVSVKGETQPKTGSLVVEVTTPSGLSTLMHVADIVIE